MPIDENTPRSVASGNARFAVAWTRGIVRTSGPYEQDLQFQGMMQRLGNTEARLKQTLHRRTEKTASNARAHSALCSTFVLLSAVVRLSLVDHRNWLTNARFTYENRDRRLTRSNQIKSVISGF